MMIISEKIARLKTLLDEAQTLADEVSMELENDGSVNEELIFTLPPAIRDARDAVENGEAAL